jgi:hypothetical protein
VPLASPSSGVPETEGCATENVRLGVNLPQWHSAYRLFVTLSGMDPLGEPSQAGDSGEVFDIRAEALDVISDALGWRLADTRWQAIEPVLVAVDAALTAGDLAALTAATADLELAGPLRITRIGTPPVVPPPPAIRDRLNRLVYSLGGAPAADQEQPGHGGADNDRSRGN